MTTRFVRVAALAVVAAALSGCGQATTVDSPASTPATATTEAVDPGKAPELGAAAAAAYVAALEAIDPDIVHGEPDKAIGRGRSQCDSVASFPDDRVKLVAYTQFRFSSPSHPAGSGPDDPGGFGPDVAARILDVVIAHLCPTT